MRNTDVCVAAFAYAGGAIDGRRDGLGPAVRWVRCSGWLAPFTTTQSAQGKDAGGSSWAPVRASVTTPSCSVVVVQPRAARQAARRAQACGGNHVVHNPPSGHRTGSPAIALQHRAAGSHPTTPHLRQSKCAAPAQACSRRWAGRGAGNCAASGSGCTSNKGHMGGRPGARSLASSQTHQPGADDGPGAAGPAVRRAQPGCRPAGRFTRHTSAAGQCRGQGGLGHRGPAPGWAIAQGARAWCAGAGRGASMAHGVGVRAAVARFRRTAAAAALFTHE